MKPRTYDPIPAQVRAVERRVRQDLEALAAWLQTLPAEVRIQVRTRGTQGAR